MITDDKPFMAMVREDITALSQWLQCIMLHVHEHNTCILCKPGPDLYLEDQLYHHNHIDAKDQEIASMNINIHTICLAIDVPVCTSVEDTRNAMSTDIELQMLQTYIVRGFAAEQRWLGNYSIKILAHKA